MPNRYSTESLAALARTVVDDGFCVLRRHFDPARLREWGQRFAPLLERHVEREGALRNRGAQRYYVTLPFVLPFADPQLFEDDDVLALVERLVGADAVMCQLATDTPLLGSDFQEVHRDAPPLFPELVEETPPFQLAINFPLVDVTLENGPLEVARGTHRLTRAEGMARLASGEARLEPVLLELGDVIVRDVRGLHRGTPNRTDVPRPMVVIGYSRRWLLRPEVSITVPREVHDRLSDRARRLLRFNRVVERLPDSDEPEIYQAFSY